MKQTRKRATPILITIFCTQLCCCSHPGAVVDVRKTSDPPPTTFTGAAILENPTASRRAFVRNETHTEVLQYLRYSELPGDSRERARMDGLVKQMPLSCLSTSEIERCRARCL